jgi:tight adherence protein C
MNFPYPILVLAAAFIAGAGAVWLVARLLFPPRLSGIRLEESAAEKPAANWAPKLAALVGPMARLVVPKQEHMRSRVRRRLMNAGWRGEHAPIIYYGMKVLLAIALPVLTLLSTLILSADVRIPALILVAAGGFLLPDVFVILRQRARKREIFNAFPEALDLMVVCVEAGLALDAAIGKVAAEIGHSSPELGDELHLATLELRAGVSRESALRNLAARTGVDDIDALVAMLIQADRFGTSIADSLRVHADGMRTKRMLRAEEAAQKLPVKLVFPVVFLIFPALFLVLLGPAVLTVMKLLLPAVR